MTTIKDIIEYTNRIAPYDTAAAWDNVGLQVGSPEARVSRVLLALDITPEVIREAQSIGAELIISHHPVIFDPLTSLAPDDAAYMLAASGISALCLHTNLDRAQEGVNVALGKALGLKNTVFYPEDFLLIGEPERAASSDEYAALIKERLNAPSIRYTKGQVSRVAVSSGGGGEGVELSAAYAFDAFVTGEMKHHQFLYAASHGIAAFDAGHFPTEDVVIAPLRDMLTVAFPDLSCAVSTALSCPYKAI